MDPMLPRSRCVEPKTIQKHVLRPPRRLPKSTQWCLGPKRQVQQLFGHPITRKKLQSDVPADKIEPRGTQKHRHVFDARSAAQTSLLHAPGARMTVVELTPSN